MAQIGMVFLFLQKTTYENLHHQRAKLKFVGKA